MNSSEIKYFGLLFILLKDSKIYSDIIKRTNDKKKNIIDNLWDIQQPGAILSLIINIMITT